VSDPVPTRVRRRLGRALRPGRHQAAEQQALLEGHIQHLEAELHRFRSFYEQVDAAGLAPYLAGDLTDTAAFLTWAPPGHFYSAIPSAAAVAGRVEAIFGQRGWRELPGIDLDEDAHAALLQTLAPLWTDFDFPAQPEAGTRYFTENGSFGAADGRVHWALLQHLRPRRLIEVGSGYSSALTLEAVDRHLGGAVDLTFIEPYPEVLESLLADRDRERVEVVDSFIQDVDEDRFRALESGDVLFIDDSHVAKVDSDVCHLLFRILPALRSGVWVHVHDVMFPFEYPQRWVEDGRTWNEAYLLRAFLQFNQEFEIAFFADAVRRSPRLAALPEAEPLLAGSGSLWLRRR
jgi:hypothetical protein